MSSRRYNIILNYDPADKEKLIEKWSDIEATLYMLEIQKLPQEIQENVRTGLIESLKNDASQEKKSTVI